MATTPCSGKEAQPQDCSVVFTLKIWNTLLCMSPQLTSSCTFCFTSEHSCRSTQQLYNSLAYLEGWKEAC
jgi:hypothetical protein